MASVFALHQQIEMIIAEHKKCGGHCHNFGEKNDKAEMFKADEHLATILSYYVKGVNDGLLRDN